MTGIDIEQFHEVDGDFTPLQSWWAEGHYDPLTFVSALVDFLLDSNEDIPSIELDEVKQRWMSKITGLDGGWTAAFHDKPGRDRIPVTLFDAEARRGGIACQVHMCKRHVSLNTPVRTALTIGEDSGPTLYLRLCSEHAKDMPGPSYRVFMVPVGAMIMLPAGAAS